MLNYCYKKTSNIDLIYNIINNYLGGDNNEQKIFENNNVFYWYSRIVFIISYNGSLW